MIQMYAGLIQDQSTIMLRENGYLVGLFLAVFTTLCLRESSFDDS